MSKKLFLGAAVLACGVLAAAAQTDNDTSRTGSTSTRQSTATSKSTTGESKTDSKFAHEAAIGGMAEVQMGQLATQKASSEEVKRFGQQMVDDHTKANDELKQIASQKSLMLPTTLDKKHKDALAKLEKVSGAAFDREYMKLMVKDHNEDIKQFDNEAKNGKDAELKQFAERTLAVLHKHHDMAKTTENALKSNTSSTTGTGSTTSGTDKMK